MKNRSERLQPIRFPCGGMIGGLAAVAMVALWPSIEADNSSPNQLGSPEAADVFDEPDADDVAAMVVDLSSELYTVRQKATLGLWQLGELALPALQKVAEGSDPEALDRAAELILYITAGVLFDSTEEVKALVLKFSRGNDITKLSVLKTLNEMGQWRQVLHLAKLEKNPKLRQKMSGTVRATALRAAREAVVEDDLELAVEILELSGDDDQALVARAWLSCQQGEFEQELARSESMPEDEGVLWRLALYRASGDVETVIQVAQKADRLDLASAFQVLVGNPLPWLDRKMDRSFQDMILSRSSQIQMARLAGDEKQADVLARELARLVINEDTAGRVINGLAANGYQKEALEILEKFDLMSAFEYYDSMESPQKALALLGIPKDAPLPYSDWVKQFTDEVIEKEDEDRYSHLLILADFLVRHGEAQHAAAVVTPMMTALEENGSDAWFDLIADMAALGLGSQAIELIENRGNEDGEADLAVKRLLDSSKSVDHLWQALKKRHDKNISKALRDLSLLAGMIADPDQETDVIHQALIDEVAAKPAEEKFPRHEALLTFAIKRHEMAKASQIVNGLAAVQVRWKNTKLFLDTAFLRWKEVEPVYAALEEENPGNHLNLVKWAMVLRKLDHQEKADKVLGRALMLTLGKVTDLHQIADELARAGYEDEALDLLVKATMMSQPDGTDFDRSIVYLVKNGATQIRNKEWKKAGAIAEVYSRFTMRGRSGSAAMLVLNGRFQADFYRGMELLKNGQRQQALDLLDSCQQLNPGSGSLADDFFPALRLAGVDQHYQKWFESSFQHVAAACEVFPKAHNAHNTAAWLASRAMLRLDDAQRHAQRAIHLKPHQGAYLDTMAEVWFAKGDRAKAVEWSEKAVAASISHAQGTPRNEGQVLSNYYELNKQLRRFKRDPMPANIR